VHIATPLSQILDPFGIRIFTDPGITNRALGTGRLPVLFLEGLGTFQTFGKRLPARQAKKAGHDPAASTNQGKSKMASLTHRYAQVASLLLAGLLLTACEGDDGPAGPEGPAGPAGPAGPPGPSGGVPVESAERITITVSSVAIPSGGGAPTVELTLTNDLQQGLFDLPANQISFVMSQLTAGSAGGSSEWQSYTTREDGGIPDVQATTENGTAGTFVDNGDGNYQYTFAQDLTAYPAGPTFDETKTHRLGIDVRRGDTTIVTNGLFTFVPAGGDPLTSREIVDNQACNACHDVFESHGGPRVDIPYCVTCHNPYSTDGDTGNTVDMKALIHNIHSARSDYQILGFRPPINDWSDLVWPQDIRNCETCHREDNPGTPEAANWRLVQNRAACGTCHYDDGVPDSGNDYAIEDGIHPAGLVFSDDTQCVNCHGPDSTVGGGALQVARVHEIDSELASEAFEFTILSISNAAVGQAPQVTFTITNPLDDDAPYDLATAPEFNACADGTSRLSVDIGWTTADYTNIGASSNGAPAHTVEINPLIGPGCGGTAQDNLDGTYTVTSPVNVPAGIEGTLGVGIEGHPWVDLNGDGQSSFDERIAVTNAILYQGIDGATTVPRRNAVAIDKCNDCHNRLSMHGSNRTNSPEVCVLCHNPNATDARQRVPVANPSDPPTDCVSVLGLDDVSVDFKFMIHALHSGGEFENPYEVCGFRNSVHEYDFKYPGKLNNCEGCHVVSRENPNPYHPVEPGTILGTTITANDPLIATDDVVISPNSAVCSACHGSDLSREHMIQNGGDFEATKAADSSLISAGIETCTLCHGPGRSADVKEVHGVDQFQFN
jgi:OmcA/MtrC family decaheme c-type cytochrome